MSEPAPDGLVLVDKPSGWTSHDVVARGRRLAHTRKVGHAGTLDPMATGLLVLGIGRATRMLGHLALKTKAYDATIRLGRTTLTDDAEGEVLTTAAPELVAAVSDASIAVGMARLTGDITQVPSAVSAIKVHGQRSYARVRAGEDVQIPARPVTVSAFTVSGIRRCEECIDLDVHVECSTGTYVRALARDLGAMLQVGGYLTALRRTRVGEFTLDQAHTLEQLEQDLTVVPLDQAASTAFATYRVTDDQVAGIRNGRPLDVDLGTPDRPVAVTTSAGEFLALYEQRDPGHAVAVAVFAPA